MAMFGHSSKNHEREEKDLKKIQIETPLSWPEISTKTRILRGKMLNQQD